LTLVWALVFFQAIWVIGTEGPPVPARFCFAGYVESAGFVCEWSGYEAECLGDDSCFVVRLAVLEVKGVVDLGEYLDAGAHYAPYAPQRKVQAQRRGGLWAVGYCFSQSRVVPGATEEVPGITEGSRDRLFCLQALGAMPPPAREGRIGFDISGLEIFHSTLWDFQRPRSGPSSPHVIREVSSPLCHVSVAEVSMEGLIGVGSAMDKSRPDKSRGASMEVSTFARIKVAPVAE